MGRSLERSITEVAEDARLAVVSPDQARVAYGVIIGADEVDMAATSARREKTKGPPTPSLTEAPGLPHWLKRGRSALRPRSRIANRPRLSIPSRTELRRCGFEAAYLEGLRSLRSRKLTPTPARIMLVDVRGPWDLTTNSPSIDQVLLRRLQKIRASEYAQAPVMADLVALAGLRRCGVSPLTQFVGKLGSWPAQCLEKFEQRNSGFRNKFLATKLLMIEIWIFQDRERPRPSYRYN